MPNKKSAEKRVRQNERRRERNRSKRAAMRTAMKTVRVAAEAGETEGLDSKLQLAQSKLAKAAKTNLVKKRNAARRTSRLAKAVAKAKTPAVAA